MSVSWDAKTAKVCKIWELEGVLYTCIITLISVVGATGAIERKVPAPKSDPMIHQAFGGVIAGP